MSPFAAGRPTSRKDEFLLAQTLICDPAVGTGLRVVLPIIGIAAIAMGVDCEEEARELAARPRRDPCRRRA